MAVKEKVYICNKLALERVVSVIINSERIISKCNETDFYIISDVGSFHDSQRSNV